MKKIVVLLKASMTENMSLFRIKNKNQTGLSKKILPIFLALVIAISIGYYAYMLMEPLIELHLEYVVLTLFILFTSIMTIMEGIYKSSGLLFNCKDDNLMFSLPIKKTTVLFIRILKFYLFELLYNSLFLLPAMVVYVRYVSVNATFYIVSAIALLLIPIIPIVISCIVGAIISGISSKFKYKNIIQIFITVIFLLAVLYISFNLDNVIKNIAQNATSINEIVTKIYYPAGAYIHLITDFNITDLSKFLIVHIAILTAMIMIFGKIYFKINSNVKSVKTGHTKRNYKIQSNSPMKALIKKELNRFITSPVFVTNAGFGLVLYVVGCILITIKIESVTQMFEAQGINISIQDIKRLIPVIQFGLVCMASLMSSITSSMISLEGKTFNILKSLPISPYKVIMSKVYTAVSIMLPFILIGDLIMFIRFSFNIIEILAILIASIILPMVSELIGIIVNLQYPKMNAENDTQVVKQSMSSMVAVFIGMGLLALTAYLLYKLVQNNISLNIVIWSGVAIYIVIYLGLMTYLKKKSVKKFNSINI